MTRWLISIAALLLSACTTPSADKAASCMGPLRPANPFGTVLLGEPTTPAPATTQASPRPARIGQNAPLSGLANCGRASA
jgi:hypothetical protein